MHSNVVLKKRGMLKSWVLLLAIMTFGLSLMGTFLVRSGLLISVHSFASDPKRGLFILIYILLVLGGARSGKTAFAEAFKVMTDAGVPDPAVLQSAVASLKGGSPYNALMKRLRTRLTRIEPPTADASVMAPQVPTGPTDASAANAQRSVSLLPDVRPDTRPETRSGVRSASPRPARVAQTAPAQKRNMTPVSKTKTLSPANVQVPRDPPPVTSVSR